MANNVSGDLRKQLRYSLTIVYAYNDQANKLPLVLLGLKTKTKQDIVRFPAGLVYGSTLNLPGEFVTPGKSFPIGVADYVQRSKKKMNSLQVTLLRRQQRRLFVPQQLYSSMYIHIRIDNVQPHYSRIIVVRLE